MRKVLTGKEGDKKQMHRGKKLNNVVLFLMAALLLPLHLLRSQVGKGVCILGEIIVEVDLKGLMKEWLGKGTDMNDLLPIM